MSGSFPMKFLNLRDWDHPDDDPDPEMVDDDETETEYRLAEVEVVRGVKGEAWE